ncbi:MAG: bifunctional 4-hydroxy-2-oxoglutarate aldolase/2-dehydro-3-deoxy-phosphogluconate aldolase [bacterium]|nr:bifunctional 4-hydroxy-2-oxoglutarate aldolase/2-dehydro-3-deoxy-phosphogluconate aldolase [bacterium]MDE0239444.1 bifunctional 4-hydroxy-2-oxoglutarate aldolase/2-dehydro-3-deoxy-phosphogluconate aldolase [bacterium]MDE0415484.1 bifunctional 4-hydroxy-2-oxoglutarate aldolase/2-dehydro-3-deoxy-phosphogluconate aldolase [bacterium]
MNVKSICALAPVIPVLTIDDSARAAPLAEALLRGGLRALEVTLRTPAALDSIGAMARMEPDIIVGAGTLLTPEDVRAASAAGARFGVSPGFTDSLLDAAEDAGLPMLPGVATPGEAMRALERGLDVLKFYPAGPNGGPSLLAAWAAPLPQIRFCPTGGINAENAASYLAIPNVICVGGSWVAPRNAVEAGDWTRIEELARAAATLGSKPKTSHDAE